jgi:4-alpha-glucanotransferase
MTKLTEGEIKEYKKTVREALDVLGKKNMSLIIHGASFPSVPSFDTGFGSPNSEGAKNLINFAKDMYNSIQLGPGGKTKGVDSSPYTGTVFSNNPLFIDLHQLTQSKWGEILPEKTFKTLVENNPQKCINSTAYSYIYKEQEKALREAYKNFKTKNTLESLKKAFESYKKENAEWLEKDSLYEALSIKYGNDYWPLWSDEVDKNLYNPQNPEQEKAAKQRIEELKKEYCEEIEFYSFCQFAASKQKLEMREFALKNNIKLIADRQVAFSDRDFWAYQSLFLDGWMLGCPPDYFSKNGQAWGFPVMDPDKLFNKDGSLGKGGELLKALYKKMFGENPGGVRIDHIIGLVDPWVYKKGHKPMPEDGAGRLFSSPEHPKLSKYAIIGVEDLDHTLEPDKEYRVKTLSKEQIKQYGVLLEKIVIQAAKEEGLSKDCIICEDLGTLTHPVEKVMEELDLSGMRLVQFVDPEKPQHPYRGINTEPKSWIMAGTHDNEPIIFWAEKNINTHEGYLHSKNLAEDLVKNPEEREAYIDKILKNPKELAKAKMVELFASPPNNIQIFFTDFFGIRDVYNRPGTSGDQNWSLRLPNDFENLYFENLTKNEGLNLPEVLKEALETKDDSFVKKNASLIQKLDEFSKKLKS